MAPGIAAITVKNGVNYDAPDGQDVKLCFIITAPKTFYWSEIGRASCRERV